MVEVIYIDSIGSVALKVRPLRVGVRSEPLDEGTAGGLAGGFVPAGSGAFFHFFAFGGGVNHQFFAALGAGFVGGFGGAVYPLDIIAALGLFGFGIPNVSAAGFEFFAEFGGF